jgi:hypothetical protein
MINKFEEIKNQDSDQWWNWKQIEI